MAKVVRNYRSRVMREPDTTANQTLGAMALVCNCHVVTYKGDKGYTLEAIDLDNFHQIIIHADELMDAVMALAKQLGVDWEDI